MMQRPQKSSAEADGRQLRKFGRELLKHIRAYSGKTENDMYFEVIDRDALRFQYLKETGKSAEFQHPCGKNKSINGD